MINWKDIEGFEGEYQVSNTGQIKSLKSNKILSQSKTGSGYYKVTLSKNNKPHYVMIHRIVAKTFLDNPNNYNVVNHIDANKENNNSNNLEWCTDRHNVLCSIKNRKNITPVISINLVNGYIQTFETLGKVKKFGYDHSNVRKCCIGKIKSYKNHKWFYN